jgi:enediyne biosynthesis protein E4
LFVKNTPDSVTGVGYNVLYHNNGDGTFTQIPNAGGLGDATHGVVEGTVCSFADYDNDGFMDVAFAGNGTTEALYHQ